MESHWCFYVGSLLDRQGLSFVKIHIKELAKFNRQSTNMHLTYAGNVDYLYQKCSDVLYEKTKLLKAPGSNINITRDRSMCSLRPLYNHSMPHSWQDKS